MSEFDATMLPRTEPAVVYQSVKGGDRFYWFCWWLATSFGPLLMAITNAKAIHFGEKKLGKRRTLIRVVWR